MDRQVISIKLEANTLEEWREQVIEFERHIRDWRVPMTVGASGTPEVLEDGDDRIAGAGMLMAHGYERFSEKKCKSGNSSLTHSITLVSHCPIPSEDKWICWDMRERLLDDGYLIGSQPDTKMTHLFHVGRDPTPGRGWLSFGARMTDEDAVLAMLTVFDGVQCLRLEGGVYLGLDAHP